MRRKGPHDDQDLARAGPHLAAVSMAVHPWSNVLTRVIRAWLFFSRASGRQVEVEGACSCSCSGFQATGQGVESEAGRGGFGLSSLQYLGQASPFHRPFSVASASRKVRPGVSPAGL